MSILTVAAPKLLSALQEIIWQSSPNDEPYEIAEKALREAGLPISRYAENQVSEKKIEALHLSDVEGDAGYSLEVYECPCGFHFGMDSTYLEQVGDIDFECPSCKETIHIEGDAE